MHVPEQRTWIDGAPVASAETTAEHLHDPNSGVPLAPVRRSSIEQVDAAIAAAERVHRIGTWRNTPVAQRATVLLRLADLLDAQTEQIARLDACNSGVPIAVTRLFAGALGDTVRAAAARATAVGDLRPATAEHGPVQLRRVPWGPTGLILPWNAPSAMAVKKLAYALAAGATTVMKPSEAAPWSAELVIAAAHEAGVPAGVANLVVGDGIVGRQIAEDDRIAAISMTGSTGTGRSIAAAAAPRFARLRLELGSNNPVIVRGDAEIGHAAAVIADGSLKLSGQWCEAPRRVFVPAHLRDDLADAIASEFAGRRIGSSLDETTEVGPVAFRARLEDLSDQRERLRAAGGRVVETGLPDLDGWFFAPTVAVIDDAGPDTEMFGPMLTVTGTESDEESLRLANTGPVGLAGYVFTADVEAGLRLGSRITGGEIKVNGASLLDMAPDSKQSFFGSSGLGGHGDDDVLDFFVGAQIIGVDRPGLPF